MARSAIFHLATALPLEKAQAIIQDALDEAHRRRLMPMTVVVLDTGGHLIAMAREDGSGIFRYQVARGKAYGALGMGLASRAMGERNAERAPFLAAVAAASEGRCVPVGGSALVLDGHGRAIGAVGVSGDTSDEDEACAIAGIEAAGLAYGIEPASD